MPTEIELPVGRIVWGHPLKSQKKRDVNNPKVLVLKDGQPVEQWVFGLAIPEAEFVAKVWPAMQAEAATGYNQGVPQNFSWKYKAGLPGHNDREGKPYMNREGYAGHYVLTISTEAFAPNVFKFENGRYRQITEQEIKCGDYVVATVQFQVNVPANKTHTPGLYVNPRGILWVAYGQEIVQTANPETLFGAQPKQFQLPPGASLQPIAPAHAAPPPGPGGPGQPYQPPGMPGPAPQQPGYAPQPNGPISTGPAPGGPGNPAYGPPGGQPYQPPGMPGPAPQQPGYAPQPMPGYPPQGAPQQPGPAPQYTPAHDFVQHAGAQPQQPGYPPQPGPAPGGYPQQPGQPYPPR